MINKKIALGVSLGILFAAALGCFLLSEKEEVEQAEPAVEEKSVPKVQVKQSVSQPAKYVPPVKKADLYNFLDKNLPLSAIADLSELPESARKTINNLLDESCGGIYFLKHNNEKAVLVVDLTPDGR